MLFFTFFLVLFQAPALADPVQIRILHVNDFHGYAEPYRPYGSRELLGGAAYLAARVEALRADSRIPTLLLAAGDMIQGNLWSNMNQGKAVIELMNMMEFDAMVVGNHEFDFGQNILKERISQANFPILGANVAGISGVKPYVIRNIGGVRVGILGIVTEKTPYLTHPDNVKNLIFKPPPEALREYLDEVRKLSDVVIVLSHIGFAEDQRLAANVMGIDVIIGGHSHTRVDKPLEVGKTIILQAWEHGKTLGVIDLTVENGRIIKIRGRLVEIKPDPEHMDKGMAVLVRRYAADVDRDMGQAIGSACVDLDGERVRSGETNLGNMVADAMREGSRADISLINAGSIRTSIKQGSISIKDVYRVLPFDNYLIVMKLKGREIVRAVEQGLAHVEEGHGSFLQVSGLQLVYDPSGAPGKRLKEIKFAGLAVDNEKIYTVAVNDFMAAGGDGFAFMKTLPREDAALRGQIVRDVVSDYIRMRKEICPQTEGRIIQFGKDRGIR